MFKQSRRMPFTHFQTVAGATQTGTGPGSIVRSGTQILAGLCLCLLGACSMKYTPPGVVAPEDMDDYQRVNAQGASVGLICKREPVVGTRLSKRTCSTAAQREAAREQARAGLEEVQRKATAPSIQE